MIEYPLVTFCVCEGTCYLVLRKLACRCYSEHLSPGAVDLPRK